MKYSRFYDRTVPQLEGEDIKRGKEDLYDMYANLLCLSRDVVYTAHRLCLVLMNLDDDFEIGDRITNECTMNNCESEGDCGGCKYCNKQFTAYEVKIFIRYSLQSVLKVVR
ncbi:hypothetical protein NQ317_013101 [Molorchus minor]|uniref:Uncharacterized protein n=1 Tax=Molorchus minor TaxID=1323400 RepID=A0ABQ9JW01_9CUCU|nr:hypothetical protein NQ317_013101 [Molorchus minor]